MHKEQAMPAKVTNGYLDPQDGTVILTLIGGCYEKYLLIDQSSRYFVEKHHWYWNSTTGQVTTKDGDKRISLGKFIVEQITQRKIGHIIMLNGSTDFRFDNLVFANKASIMEEVMELRRKYSKVVDAEVAVK